MRPGSFALGEVKANEICGLSDETERDLLALRPDADAIRGVLLI